MLAALKLGNFLRQSHLGISACHGCVEKCSGLTSWTSLTTPDRSLGGDGWGNLEIGNAGYLEQFGIHNISTDFSLERRFFLWRWWGHDWMMTPCFGDQEFVLMVCQSQGESKRRRRNRLPFAQTVYRHGHEKKPTDLNRENFSYHCICSCRSRPYDSRLEEGQMKGSRTSFRLAVDAKSQPHLGAPVKDFKQQACTFGSIES